jgi:hypothetical protein
VINKRSDVIGHQPDVDRTIDVGSAAVPLQVNGNDLVALRQSGTNRPEHLTRSQSAMQQDQRPSGPHGFVIEIEAVDLGVLAGASNVGCPIGGGHGELLS